MFVADVACLVFIFVALSFFWRYVSDHIPFDQVRITCRSSNVSFQCFHVDRNLMQVSQRILEWWAMIFWNNRSHQELLLDLRTVLRTRNWVSYSDDVSIIADAQKSKQWMHEKKIWVICVLSEKSRYWFNMGHFPVLLQFSH